MIEGKTVAVVVPCHNEEAGLRTILPARPPEVDEVIIVDNNCADQTAVVAREHGARVVSEPVLGYGSAYQAGLRAVTADIIVTMDGDGQYDIREIPRLVHILLDGELDILLTTRFPLTLGSMPLLRVVGNRVLTAAAWLLFGAAIRDTQSGMWIFHRRILEVVRATERGMAYSEEFKLKAARAGLKFSEAHIRYLPRRGASKLAPFGDGWKNLVYLVRLRCGRPGGS